MNICYLIDVSPERFRGGGQAHLLNLIKQMQFSRGAGSGFAGQILTGKSPNFIFRLLWMVYVIPQAIFYHFFRQKFDLIHAHSIPAMVSGKILSLILGIPVVVTVHGYNEKHWMEKLVLTKIKYDAQITVARNFLQIPNVNKHVVYIPNGVDLGKYKKVQKSTKKYKKGRVVLFVGRKNDPVKGFSILLQALELVKKEIPEVKLLVAGGDLPQETVLQMYWEANLFVLPSLSEGFPLTLLEAWASKLPVLVTRVGELPYLVKDEINGYLVDPGSARQLALAVIEALRNKNLAKLGESGYNQAKEHTWKKTAGETIRVYQKICLKY
ncbi:glycosyltransferase family 4 protein [Candidatus Collierbacteria bacterium]|nr:glycosyltransferase family 4 protein [Candidatus Collierbacteria bacterium]